MRNRGEGIAPGNYPGELSREIIPGSQGYHITEVISVMLPKFLDKLPAAETDERKGTENFHVLSFGCQPYICPVSISVIGYISTEQIIYTVLSGLRGYHPGRDMKLPHDSVDHRTDLYDIPVLRIPENYSIQISREDAPGIILEEVA